MNRQRGYTMVEAAVALIVLGVIAVTVGMAVQQLVTVPDRGNDHVTALHDLQNAAHWVSLDVQEAKSAVGGTSLSLTLPDNSVISYTRAGTTLTRTYDGLSNIIAESITSLSFTVTGKAVFMNITSQPVSRWSITETKSYETIMRYTG